MTDLTKLTTDEIRTIIAARCGAKAIRSTSFNRMIGRFAEYIVVRDLGTIETVRVSEIEGRDGKPLIIAL